MNAAYQERKETGLCTWGACPLQAEEDRQLCTRHKIRKAKRLKKRRRAIRRERREAGLCAICGIYRSEEYRCCFCKSRDRNARPPTNKVSTSGSTDDRAARIAAATRVDLESAQADRATDPQRQRYHGRMRRGAPTKQEREADDVRNLQWAARGMAEAAHELALAYRSDYACESERENAIRAAVAKGDHASRLAEEVSDRNLMQLSRAANRKRRP